MNHKKRRPINRRAGCKLCRPWKINGIQTRSRDGEKFSDHRRRVYADLEVRNYSGKELGFRQFASQEPAS